MSLSYAAPSDTLLNVCISVFSLQFGVRRRLEAEGCGEETVQAFSVSDPQPPLVPGTQAPQAHETRER